MRQWIALDVPLAIERPTVLRRLKLEARPRLGRIPVMPLADTLCVPSRVIAGAAPVGAVLVAAPASAEIKSFRDWMAAWTTCDCNAYGLTSSLRAMPICGRAQRRCRCAAAHHCRPQRRMARIEARATTRTWAACRPTRRGQAEQRRRLQACRPPTRKASRPRSPTAQGEEVTSIDPAGATPSEPLKSEISSRPRCLAVDDEQQKRVGTVTALIGCGDKLASAVPPPLRCRRWSRPGSRPPWPKKAPAVVAKARGSARTRSSTRRKIPPGSAPTRSCIVHNRLSAPTFMRC